MWPFEKSNALKRSIRFVQKTFEKIRHRCTCRPKRKDVVEVKRRAALEEGEENRINVLSECCARLKKVLSKIFKSSKFRSVPGNHELIHLNIITFLLEGVQSYGPRIFAIWMFYSFFVAIIITVVPLEILKNATSVDKRNFEIDQTSRKLLSEWDTSHVLHWDGSHDDTDQEIRLYHPTLVSDPAEKLPEMDEGKTGFDMASVGIVVMLQCIVVSGVNGLIFEC